MNNNFVKFKNKSLNNLKPNQGVIKKGKKQEDFKKLSVNPEINYNNFDIPQRYSNETKTKKSKVAKEDTPFLNNFFKYNDFYPKLVEGIKKNLNGPKSNNNRYNLFKSNNQVFNNKKNNTKKINKEKNIIMRSKSNNKENLKQSNNLNNKALIKDLKVQISKNKIKPPLINIDLTQDEKNEKESKNDANKKNSPEISKNKNGNNIPFKLNNKNKKRNSHSPNIKIPSININLNNIESQNRNGNKKENLKKSDNNNINIKVSINYLDNNINDVSQKNESIKRSKNSEDFISYGFVEYQNIKYRDTMEDFHDYKKLCFNNLVFHYFSIFDGHNGKEVALYLKDNFHIVLLNELKLITFTNDYKLNNAKIISAIKNSFETIDKNIIDNKKIKDDIGSTGTVIFVYSDPYDNSKRMMICANVGDSKGYLVTKENIMQITKDHKCDDASEVERIKNFGGLVFQGRVFGSLMITRSFGDKEMKMYGVVSIPYCFSCLISDNDQYIIAASDGVWDAFQNINDIYELSKEEMTSEIFVKKIVQLSIDRGTCDNISCLVLKLNKIN